MNKINFKGLFILNTIKGKIIVSVFLIGTVGVLLALIFTYISNQEMEKVAIDDSKERLLKDISSRIDKKKDIGLTNVLGFASNGKIREALEIGDRELAFKELTKIGSFYKNNSNFKGIKAHVHTKDGHSFVKSWKKGSFGEDLTYRDSIKTVMKTHKALVVLEVGNIGFMIRGVSPIFDKSGEYIGSIEFLQGVGSVSRDFLKDGNRFILLLNKNAEKISPKIAKNQKIDEFYVANNKWFSDDTVIFAQEVDYEKLFQDGHYLTEDFFTTYIDVKDSKGEQVGIFVVGEPIKKFQKNIEETLNLSYSFVLLVLIIISIVIITLLIIININFKPLNKLIELTKELSSGEGDLTKRLECKGKENCKDVDIERLDEVGKVSFYINIFLEQIHNIVLKSKTTAQSNRELSQKLLSSSSDILKRVEHEAEIITLTTDTWNKMDGKLFVTISELESLRGEIDETSGSIALSKKEIFNMIDKLQINAGSEKELSGKLKALTHKAENTKEALGGIISISEEIKLLALNAAIEAAHAGERGKGFSVVSDRIQELAEKTQEDLDLITESINSVINSVNEASGEISRDSDDMRQLVEISHRVEKNMNITTSTVARAKNFVNHSSVATNDIKSGSKDMVDKVHDLYHLSKENVEGIDGIQKMFAELKNSTEELNTILNRFKT